MIIAQITDLHVRPEGRLVHQTVDTNAMMRAAVGAVARLDPLPDAVVATGDLVDFGTAAEYRILRAALDRLPMPVYLVPGNHDTREGLREVFPDHAYLLGDGPIRYTVEHHPVRLVALDTTIPGRVDGAVGAEQAAWLDARLAEAPERPTVVIMHHPPFRTGLPHMDEIGCADGEVMAEVVARHGQVERVLCGHHHRAIQMRWAGTIASVAPSTAHQFGLLLNRENPFEVRLEPPAIHVHHFIPGNGIVTHHAYVEAFPGPYPGGSTIKPA